MMAFERRWVHGLLEAFAPPGAAGLAPQTGEVDYVAGFDRMHASFPKRAALGLRVALWMAALAPLWMWGRLRRVARMSIGERTALLHALSTHRSGVVRDLTFLLKTVASIAMLGTPSVRARSHYDRDVAPAWSARPRRALPVAPGWARSAPPPKRAERPSRPSPELKPS